MTERRRADLLLVERGLFESRARAQAAIAAGLVTADNVTVAKPSSEIRVDAALQAAPAHPWVSRGGVKLAAALDTSGLDVAGRACLDVGASTGGFSEVLLARGARRVYQSTSAMRNCIRGCAGLAISFRWRIPIFARSTRRSSPSRPTLS
jgi:23S rRNA (cytidine1920-2'-O)/16S rRNA (cytidine1409-2'-O)-methyltransferase